MTAATDAVRDGDPCTAPDDVDCSVPDAFPCFACYLSGRADIPTDAGSDAENGGGR